MGLSSDLVSAFTKITNDSKPKKTSPSLYGTIVKYDEDLYVQLDGSKEVTPISRTVEVSEGDRVAVTIANHAATVTGNLSDPAIGYMKAGNLESNFTQTAEQIRAEVSDLEKKLTSSITQTASDIRSELSDEVNGLQTSITQNTTSITNLVKKNDEFSEFKQTIEGFSFMGKGGSVKINGGDIVLTGSITFADLDEATQDKIADAEETANQAISDASEAKSDAASAIEIANEAYDHASAIGLPSYIKSNKITRTTIESPTIKGNEIQVYGTFQTIGYDGTSEVTTGYMGAAKGMDSDGNDTFGVALSNSWSYDNYRVGESYVIVTNAGVRLQYGDNNVVVSKGGIYLNAEGADAKAYYNGVEIGSGAGGTVGTAVWG